MPDGGLPDAAREPRGVLDAGVVLARLDPSRRSHKAVRELFDRCTQGKIRLMLSMVNLAEALQYARDYQTSTGFDLIAALRSYDVALHSPDLPVVRRVAELAVIHDASLGDRFAMATAQINKSRLYTTDPTLLKYCRQRKLPVTHF